MKYEVNDALPNSESNVNGQGSAINWNDFNYPCLLKMFHFTRKELPEQFRRVITMLWVNHILIWAVELLNLITNIVATASGFQDGIRIGISVCLMVAWYPLGLYTFYLGYMLLMKNEGSRFVFYLLSFITFVFFSIWSIADFADANGFVRMSNLFKADKGFAGVLALLNSIISLGVAGLALVNAIIVFRANR